jgi:hypothetical protein
LASVTRSNDVDWAFDEAQTVAAARIWQIFTLKFFAVNELFIFKVTFMFGILCAA